MHCTLHYTQEVISGLGQIFQINMYVGSFFCRNFSVNHIHRSTDKEKESGRPKFEILSIVTIILMYVSDCSIKDYLSMHVQ